MPTTRYLCPSCAREFALETPRWRCDCGSHLDLTPGPGLAAAEIRAERRSLWRYEAALAERGPPAVALGEGWTPLLETRWDGRTALFKLEFLAPSGSFKDRGVAVMLNHLARLGIAAVHEDSSGNGGVAVATYAAAAGLSCRIFVPAATSRAKVVQIVAAGSQVVLVDGSREDVAAAAMAVSGASFYASHNWHPMFLEGMKTLGFELWEQLGFRVPDCIVAPLGGGSSVLGCWNAFTELKRRGVIDRVPRLYGVQAENCAPMHRRFVGAGGAGPWRPTIAEGIALAAPVRIDEVVGAIRASGGATIAVSEAEIVAALRRLARSGFFVEPTSAAAAAGLSRLIGERAIGASETPVLVLTGSGLKAADRISTLLSEDAR